MLYKQFYTEVGKLLYALAGVDGTVSEEEVKLLHELVHKELVPVEKNKDEYGTDAAYYVDFELELMGETHPKPERAFESFISFVEEHKTAIDERMILATRKVATKLTDANHQRNEKEKELLARLNKKLNALLKEQKAIVL